MTAEARIVAPAPGTSGPPRRASSVPSVGRSIDWAAQEWDDLVPRLLLLAASRIARMAWRRRSDAPSLAEAEDFVHDAITKTMAGARVWKPEVCTLFQHLAGVIVSDVSHAATSSESRLTSRHDPDTEEPIDGAADQEQAALWRAEQRRLVDHLSGIDPMMGRMAELILAHDLHETTELCRALSVAPAAVANLRRRMKRAVRAYLMENQR